MPDQQLPPGMSDRIFSPSANDIASMTHGPEQPNTAKPYLDAAARFSQHGLTGAFPSLRQYMPGWLNTLGGIVQSPVAKDAFSTANIGGFPLVEIGIPWTSSELSLLRRMMESPDKFSAKLLPGRTPAAILRKMEDLASQPTKEVRKATPAISNDPEKVNQIMSILSSGMNVTHSQLAEKIGVSERTLRRFINDVVGIRTSKSFGSEWNNPERIKQYQYMIDNGWTQPQMAKKLNTSDAEVSRQLRKLSQAGYVNYTPGGGTRSPSMPSFKFQKGEALGDPEYENALLLYLQGLGRGK